MPLDAAEDRCVDAPEDCCGRWVTVATANGGLTIEVPCGRQPAHPGRCVPIVVLVMSSPRENADAGVAFSLDNRR